MLKVKIHQIQFGLKTLPQLPQLDSKGPTCKGKEKGNKKRIGKRQKKEKKKEKGGKNGKK